MIDKDNSEFEHGRFTSIFIFKKKEAKCHEVLQNYCYQHRDGTVLLLTTLTACTSPGSKLFRNIEDIYK